MKNSSSFVPLNDSQMGIYLDCFQNPESTMYNIPVCHRYESGQVDVARLADAVHQALEHFEAFHLYIGQQDGLPFMMRQETTEFAVECRSAQESEFEQRKTAFVRPFDLTHAPLFRAQIITTPESVYLLVDAHHILSDGTSMSVLGDAIRDAYQGIPILPELLVPSVQSQLEQQDAPQEKAREALAYFTKELGGVEVDSNLPVDRPDATSSLQGNLLKMELDVPFDTVEQIARRFDVTKGTIFLTAFAYALAKTTCQPESLFCTVSSGRHHEPLLSHTVGMFVRTLPFYAKFDENGRIEDQLKAARRELSASIAHDCVSFAALAKELGLRSDILFTYQSTLFNTLDMLETPDTQANLTFLVFKRDAHYEVRAAYRTCLYEEQNIRRLMELFGRIVKGFAECGTFREISLQSEQDCVQITRFNQTERPLPAGESIVSMFRQQAARTPENTAVVYKDARLTYAQVEALTDRIAAALHARGVGKGDFVPVLLPRCAWMPVAALGVLKCGAAYQPLDPTYPTERLAFMVKDSAAKLLIADHSLLRLLPEYTGETLCTDEFDALPQGSCPPDPAPEDPFILLYTSGTTGTPKGAQLSHRNLVNFCLWYIGKMEMDRNSRVAAYASFGFDANMMDTWPTLLCGAQLHILPEEIRLDLPVIDDYFCKNGITHSFMTTQVGRQFAMMTSCESLRCMSVGGEKLVPLTPPAWMHFHNGYGPTECTIFTTTYPVISDSKLLPIGRPLDNTKLYVVDNQMRQLPIGAAGELCIAGAPVGMGYLNRPEQTEKVFVKNPFSDDPEYAVMYRTGDIVRWLPDGNIEFLGRRDGQVKVRGFRIELTEVEQVIREYPGIQDATVAAFDAPSGGKFVAAYVVSEETVDIDALNAFIAERKPPYMVPAVTMQIDRIPLNQNQKVNRRALPVPQRRAKQIVPPTTETQKTLCAIVERLIGEGSIGIQTDLYDAGLTSISSIQLTVQLAKAFDTVVQISDLKAHRTVEELERFLAQTAPAAEYALQSDYPLSQTQNGIFVECISKPESTVYNIPFCLQLDNSVDVSRLQTALAAAMDAHPYFKAVLRMTDDGDIRAKRQDDAPACIEIKQAQTLPGPEELVRPFSLLGGCLYRITIYCTPRANYLMLEFHHILCDGTSLAVFLRDTDRAYRGEALQKESYTGYEFSLDEEAARKSEKYTRAKAYYDGIFQGCETDCLPGGDAPAKPSASVGTFRMESALAPRRLASWCKQHNVTENAFFNTVFGFVLSKYCGREDAVYTTIYNGRSDPRLADSGAMLVKTFPVYQKFEGETDVAGLVQATGRQLTDSMANDLYSFAEISHAYGITADVMFVYQGAQFVFDHLAGAPARNIPLGLDTEKAPLNLNIFEEHGVLVYSFEYAASRYTEEAMQEFAECMDAAAESFLHCQKVRQLTMLSDRARALLEGFNATDDPIQPTTCNLLFEQQVEKTPDRVAVIVGGKQRTYRELNADANRVAHALISQGVHADQMVGVMMPRIAEAYAVRQGVMKAGGAFMPLDPMYPDDRIAYIFEDSGSRLAVTTAQIAQERAALFARMGVTVLVLEELLRSEKTHNPSVVVRPQDLCYVLYTSGSTGRPKGCMMEHHSLVNFVSCNPHNTQANAFCKDVHVRLSLAAMTFDVSVLEETLVLYHGLTGILATEEEIHNPLLLADLILKNNVDIMKCTPSFMNSLLDLPEMKEALCRLKALGIGAEPFPAPLYRKMRRSGITAEIYNGYGPTETTITCAMAHLKGDRITIGRPMSNMKIFMLDKFGHILPPSVPGELTILGECVGRGYVANETLTREKFITVGGQPAYRSGDLAKWNRSGFIDFIGRMDNQVKLRGLRVELEEIENAMNSYPSVTRSVVLVKGNDAEEQFLCGYFTASETVDPQALTAHIQKTLTAYMVPSILMQLNAFPMNNNGKVDKKALPEPEFKATQRNMTAPVTELQKQLCGLFAAALHLDEVGINEDFFALGGTSLSASKVAVRAMVENLPIAYGDIFSCKTVENLEQHVLSLSAKKAPVQREEAATVGEFATALSCNTVPHAQEARSGELGDVLLTGATGYLGIHVLRALLDRADTKIYCLLRKAKHTSPENRLKSLLVYYFDRSFDEAFGTRLFVMEGDITDAERVRSLAEYPFQTVINCAASVKHFSSDDTLDKINVHGVKNLIALCEKTHRRLIQTSTTSVAGENVNNKFPETRLLHENELYFGQDLSNKYVSTKFQAEKAILTEVEAGKLDAKIMRLGNLMSRNADGEFQINFVTNGFMLRLRGYAAIGKFPVSHMDDRAEFSPIDCTAEAILLLAGTDSRFTVFHPRNSHTVQMGDLIAAMNEQGIPIQPVDDDLFTVAMQSAMQDDAKNAKVASLISYLSSDTSEKRSFIQNDNTFTTKVLYRLGFRWPITNETYLAHAIGALKTLGFFDGEVEE